jgi:hypothetical protein
MDPIKRRLTRHDIGDYVSVIDGIVYDYEGNPLGELLAQSGEVSWEMLPDGMVRLVQRIVH